MGADLFFVLVLELTFVNDNIFYPAYPNEALG